jgi:hypothetical protein
LGIGALSTGLVPFWEWLLMMADLGHVKMPRKIYDEVANSPDLLGQWLRLPVTAIDCKPLSS